MSGERRVFEFFQEHFDGWEIYCQPHLNGRKPDFALLNRGVGLGIFEVKDWDLTSKDWHRYRSAIEQANQYGSVFTPIFGARHNCLIDFPVTVGLIFTRASNSDVHKYFREFLDGTPYRTLVGRETLERGDRDQVFPLAGRRNPMQLTQKAADDLRSWLVEPQHASEARQNLEDDPRQRRFVENPDDIKLRRMRGSAGSGKSVTLVRRAAKVAAEGKDVLFICYNRSLMNYLKQICQRTGDAAPSQIQWRTFHSHCAHLYSRLGLGTIFESLAADQQNWDEVIPSSILEKVASGPAHLQKFDAIYVDEGQDINLSWWNVLRSCLRENGEMMIAFDTAQQIYPRTEWNTETLPGAGFSGKWIELGGSRRLPNSMLPVLRSFAEQFHPKALDSLPEAAAGASSPCALRWVQVRPERRVAESVKELMRIIQRDTAQVSRAMTDLTLLCDRRDDCIEAEKYLAGSGIAVTNVVNGEGNSDREAKQNFTMTTPRVKICTFPSFKGWQSRLIVLSISKFAGKEDAASIYTMLTRVKAHSEGSNLTVVCSQPKLRPFGSTFPDFDCRS